MAALPLPLSLSSGKGLTPLANAASSATIPFSSRFARATALISSVTSSRLQIGAVAFGEPINRCSNKQNRLGDASATDLRRCWASEWNFKEADPVCCGLDDCIFGKGTRRGTQQTEGTDR